MFLTLNSNPTIRIWMSLIMYLEISILNRDKLHLWVIILKVKMSTKINVNLTQSTLDILIWAKDLVSLFIFLIIIGNLAAIDIFATLVDHNDYQKTY